MTLLEYVEAHTLCRSLADNSARNLLYAVATFERWAGRSHHAKQLTEEKLSRWVKWLEESGYSLDTINGHRANMLTIWNGAADRGLCRRPDCRLVRKPKGERDFPTAWTPADVRSLLDACDLLRGHPLNCPIERRPLMRAWILVAWDTGLRPWADQLRIERHWIRPDGVLTMKQHKTGWPVMCRLNSETLEAIAEIFPPDRALVFPCHYKTLDYNWRKVAKLAGVKGPFKQMRATRATVAEFECPGSAPAALGHKPGSTVAYARYVDPRKSVRPENVPMAPPLWPPDDPGREAG